MVRPAGVAEDSALSNWVARGGGPRPHPIFFIGCGRLIPAGGRSGSDAILVKVAPAFGGPESRVTDAELNATEGVLKSFS